jgi:hypothetical protein
MNHPNDRETKGNNDYSLNIQQVAKIFAPLISQLSPSASLEVSGEVFSSSNNGWRKKNYGVSISEILVGRK